MRFSILTRTKSCQLLFRSLPLAVAALGTLAGQTQIDLKTQSRNVDFTTAPSTRPTKAGTSLPTTCSPGELFFNLAVTAGQNLYACSSQNSWTQIGGGQISILAGAVQGEANTNRLRDIISVVDAGADPTGANDSQPAIQAAAGSGKCLYFPIGIYKLQNPITISGGECFIGPAEAAHSLVQPTALLLPTTAAFVTASPLSQVSGLLISGLYIKGGTNLIDLGIMFDFDIENVVFQDYTGWAIAHVNGERNIIRNVRCRHVTTAATGCISVGDPGHSLFASTYVANPQQFTFFDHSQINNVVDIGNLSDLTKTDNYVIWSDSGSNGQPGNQFDNNEINEITAEGTGMVTPFRFYNLTNSRFENLAVDVAGTSSAAAAALFEVDGFTLNTTIDNFFPGFANSDHYNKALYFAGQVSGLTVRNCDLGGDNSTYYGAYFQATQNSYVLFEGSKGALYYSNPSSIWRNEIQIVASNMNPNNMDAGIQLNDITNKGMTIQLMGDGDGTLSSSGVFQVKHASGQGSWITDLSTNGSSGSFGVPWNFSSGLTMQTSRPQPACNSTSRGMFWYLNNGTSKDSVQVCVYNGSTFVWASLY